jgi:protoheme IX farnesyltransferase
MQSTVEGETRDGVVVRLLSLSKARLSLLVALTAFAGYVVASPGGLDWIKLFWTVSGTLLAAAGANSFNQWLEVDADSRMKRTRSRPLPARTMTAPQAFFFAVIVSILGLWILYRGANPLTAGLALFNILLYVLVYTPLKYKSPLCTLIGAVNGAIPPMMGWTAATGSLGWGGWLMGGLLFTWQIPHFLALAWLYRSDYERGGFVMLPAVDPKGLVTRRVTLLYAMAVIPLCLLLFLSGLTGPFFAFGALILGMALVIAALKLYTEASSINARRVFLGGLAQLFLLIVLLAADHPPLRDRAPVVSDSIARNLESATGAPSVPFPASPDD